jgi:hypothetical protein
MLEAATFDWDKLFVLVEFVTGKRRAEGYSAPQLYAYASDVRDALGWGNANKRGLEVIVEKGPGGQYIVNLFRLADWLLTQNIIVPVTVRDISRLEFLCDKLGDAIKKGKDQKLCSLHPKSDVSLKTQSTL